ncbi:MAG: MazG family protein [Lachnospiraceae bacterium]
MSEKFDRFCEVVTILRSEKGCPWDREQTNVSLRSCLLEECYELMTAISNYEELGDIHNFKEELGDVLLQIVMHCQIAKEDEVFTIEDVLNDITNKMIYRHPHVFGEVIVDSSTQVLENWEQLKKKEKKDVDNPMHQIPKYFPALLYATKVKKCIASYYNQTTSMEQSIENMEIELSNLKKETSTKETIEKRLSNIIMETTNIAWQNKISLEQVMLDEIKKLIIKYEDM